MLSPECYFASSKTLDNVIFQRKHSVGSIRRKINFAVFSFAEFQFILRLLKESAFNGFVFQYFLIIQMCAMFFFHCYQYIFNVKKKLCAKYASDNIYLIRNYVGQF